MLSNSEQLSPAEKAQFQAMPTDDRETTSLSIFSHQPPKVAIERRANPKASALLRFERVILNDKLAYVLEQYDQNKGQSTKPNDESGYYSFGYIRPSTELLKDGLVDPLQLSDPRYHCYFDHLGGEPIDQRLLRPDFKAVYLGEEIINGSRCMKMEVSFLQDAKILYWIDAEHGFLLRRREERTYSGKDLLREETVVPELQESNGVWLPKTVETRQFIEPVNSKAGQSPEIDPSKVIVTRTTFSDFKANTDIPTSTFDMKWPKGANVRNQISLTGFIADGKQINEGKDLKSGVVKKTDAGAAKQDEPIGVKDKPAQ
jgi:hypothetical protein